MFKYMPSFEDFEGRRWDLMSIDFVIMGFGRGLIITAHNKELGKDKSFVYSYLQDAFKQWNYSEIVDCEPLESNLNTWFNKLFKLFDNSSETVRYYSLGVCPECGGTLKENNYIYQCDSCEFTTPEGDKE